MVKILQARLQQYVNREFLMFKLVLEKAEETDQIANIHWIIEKAREFHKNIYFCFIDYTKAFDCVDHNKLWKILQEMGIPDHLTCLLRSLYAGQEETEPDLEEQTGSKLGKEYVNAVYCHPAYLSHMQSSVQLNSTTQSCPTLCDPMDCSIRNVCWMKQKLEARFPGEISITSDMQMTPSLWQKVKRN